MSCLGPSTLVLVTGRKDKLAEARAILGIVIELQTQSLDLAEVQDLVSEIAKNKCQQAATAVKGLGARATRSEGSASTISQGFLVHRREIAAHCTNDMVSWISHDRSQPLACNE